MSNGMVDGFVETIQELESENAKLKLRIADVSGSLFYDDKIDDEAWERYPQNIYNNGEDEIFAEGARWMRERIKMKINNDDNDR
jgi:hypothetical protein